jgi:invasion protein IalB
MTAGRSRSTLRIGYVCSMKRLQERPAAALSTLLVTLALAAGAWASPATQAASPDERTDQPRKLVEYGEWRAFVMGTGEERACYVTPREVPAQADGRAKDRPLLYVTYRPGKNALNVVSYFAGYDIRPGSDIEFDFGGAKFRLFTQEGSNGAWSPSPELDARIVDAMKARMSLTVRGVDRDGREVTDTFSLQGFTAVLYRATNECGIR